MPRSPMWLRKQGRRHATRGGGSRIRLSSGCSGAQECSIGVPGVGVRDHAPARDSHQRAARAAGVSDFHAARRRRSSTRIAAAHENASTPLARVFGAGGQVVGERLRAAFRVVVAEKVGEPQHRVEDERGAVGRRAPVAAVGGQQELEFRVAEMLVELVRTVSCRSGRSAERCPRNSGGARRCRPREPPRRRRPTAGDS